MREKEMWNREIECDVQLAWRIECRLEAVSRLLFFEKLCIFDEKFNIS